MEDLQRELDSRRLQYSQTDLPRFLELQNRFHFTSSTVVSKWDAFLLNHTFSANSFEQFASMIAKQASRKRERGILNAETIEATASKPPTIHKMSSPPASSRTGTSSNSAISPSLSAVLGSPPVPQTVVRDPKTLHTHNGALSTFYRAGNSQDVKIRIASKTNDGSNAARTKFRYMWQRADDIRNSIEDVISRRALMIAQRMGIDESLLVNASHASAEPVFVAGMIGNDVSATYGKLNLHACELVDVDGISVRLDFRSYLQAQAEAEGDENKENQKSSARIDGLFPGQVVIVEGLNTDGSTLLVRQIFSNALGPKPHNAPVSSADPLSNSGFSVCVMSGPFGGSIQDALAKARLSHGALICGQLTANDEREIAEFQAESGTSVWIVPSHESETNDLFVFPQPGNPTIVELAADNVSRTIGLVSMDVLTALAREEISLVKDRDRFASLCRHLLDQGSFMPLVPPSESIPFDQTMLDRASFSERPDVLILPSILQHFVKDVEGTICINPRTMSNRQVAVIHFSADGQVRVDIDRI